MAGDYVQPAGQPSRGSKNAWAQIDVNLKRRSDLIPNLVSTVKGYAAHESETLEKVVESRNRFDSAATPAERMEASNELTAMLSRLMLLVEAYPDLKANQNFIQLQNELRETEDKIAFTRRFYNDTVMKLNAKLEDLSYGTRRRDVWLPRRALLLGRSRGLPQAPKVEF